MTAYELFEKMINAYKKYDTVRGMLDTTNQDFIRYASLLARKNVENPYDFNSEEYDTYYDFLYFYDKWPKQKNSCAFKSSFLLRAEKLCTYNNPFKEDSDE